MTKGSEKKRVVKSGEGEKMGREGKGKAPTYCSLVSPLICILPFSYLLF
jgi:hypothetical protein